jgi:hypothetical protein
VFVVMVAPEWAPVAQAGGLGDVVFGLSRKLERRTSTHRRAFGLGTVPLGADRVAAVGAGGGGEIAVRGG